jgi:hypothetical protein
VSGNTATASGSGGNAEGGGIVCGSLTGGTTIALPTLLISGSTITNNHATQTFGSSNTSLAAGGGIFEVASLATITNTSFTNNMVSNANGTSTSTGLGSADGGGAFIASFSSTLTNLTVRGNTASAGAGGATGGRLFFLLSAQLSASTVSGNHATSTSGNAQGGGIFNVVSLSVSGSTVANNDATSSTANAGGGGINNADALALTNDTLFGNSVTASNGTAQGGGLDNAAPVTLTTASTATLVNVTVASNTATGMTAKGGGIINESGNTLNLVNTVVYDPAGPAGTPDVSGTISGTQTSLYGSAVAGQFAAGGDLGGNQFSTNPVLGPLADNGGPTQTMALLPASPAIDAGTNFSVLGTVPNTDQRGLPRPQGAATDIGAFEVQPPPAPPAQPQPQPQSLALPLVFAFLLPAPRGQIGVSGFVFDPDNLAEEHIVVIDWHDGTGTTLLLPAGVNLFGAGGTYSFFPKQTHKKHRHQTVTVYVVDQQVVAELAAGGRILPHFDLTT